jgi:hypothetical protein
MAFGILINNPSGEMVLSSDTYFPVYLGKATVVSTVQPFGSGTAATGTGNGGYSTCSFNYAGQIVPVLKLAPGHKGTIYSCTQSGSTWTIRASYTNGSQVTDLNSPTNGMFLQTAPEIFVFGFVTSLGGSYGAAIYNSSGVLVGDLTRRPLILKQRMNLPVNTTSAAVNTPAVVPGVLGRCFDTSVTGGPTGIPEIYRLAYSQYIFSCSSTTFARGLDRRKIMNTGADNPHPDSIRGVDVWLVELNGLT